MVPRRRHAWWEKVIVFAILASLAVAWIGAFCWAVARLIAHADRFPRDWDGPDSFAFFVSLVSLVFGLVPASPFLLGALVRWIVSVLSEQYGRPTLTILSFEDETRKGR